jgi:hypothetical protein
MPGRRARPSTDPYALRHSFASLLLAEGKQPTYVSRQLGHSIAVLFSTYSHLISEFEDRSNIDAEAEIREARSLSVPRKALAECRSAPVWQEIPANRLNTATGIRNGLRSIKMRKLCLQIATFGFRPNRPRGAGNRLESGVDCGVFVARSALAEHS